MNVQECLRNILSIRANDFGLSEAEFESIAARTIRRTPGLRTALLAYLDRTDIDWISLLEFDSLEIYETTSQDDARKFIRGLLIPLLQDPSK
jgi:hypothetical protein